MGAEEAIEEFINIWEAVFADATLDRVARSATLEAVIRDLLERRGLEGTRKLFIETPEDSICKAFICAVPESNLRTCEKFRNYKSKGAYIKPTIVEAIRATCAAPILFTPVSIESIGYQISYVTGAYNFNNPAVEMATEACAYFGGNQPVSCLLSLGCGQRATVRLTRKTEAAVVDVANDIASDCELVDRELARRIGEFNVYHRLSVDRDLGPVDVSSLNLIGDIMSCTEAFLECPAIVDKADQCVEACERIGRVILKDTCRLFIASMLNPHQFTGGFSEPKSVAAHGLPALSAFYVERPDLIKTMEQCLFRPGGPPAQRRMVISGLGGIGKTQITISFLLQFLSR